MADSNISGQHVPAAQSTDFFLHNTTSSGDQILNHKISKIKEFDLIRKSYMALPTPQTYPQGPAGLGTQD
jgi:hypothetical protein